MFRKSSGAQTASLLLVGVSLAAVSSAACAQTSAPDEPNKADIVVTAKSRTEKLQDVPLSITALSSGELQAAQVRDVRDLQNVTPNLSLFTSSGRNDPSGWALRGLTSNTSDERYQSISIFLDGIALSGELASLGTENVERVEVIKGPQSATFGRATYSGAINFITKDPSGDEATGSVLARGSFNKGSHGEPSYLLSGSLTVPLVKGHLWLTVDGNSLQNGRVANAADTGDPIGRERSQRATASLFWTPDPTFKVKLRGLYSHDRDSITTQTIEEPRDWLAAGVPTVPLPRGGGSFLPAYLPDPDPSEVATHGRTGFTRDRYFASAIVSKMFGGYELNYRGGYFRDVNLRDGPSFPRATGPGQDPIFGALIGTPAISTATFANSFSTLTRVYKNTSHQLVLLSPGEKPFRWRIGAYYFWESDDNSLQSRTSPTNPLGLIPGQQIRNKAVFGGFDWKLGQSFTLSGEARYAHEAIHYDACSFCNFPNSIDTTRGSNDFTPRVTLSYSLSPDHLLYALFSRGVKSGRFSNVTPKGGTQLVLFAKPEKMNNYEVGSKNTFLDGRMVLNLSAFYDRITDQQLTSVTSLTVVNTAGKTVSADIVSTANVGTSEVLGFEAESTIRVTPQFMLRGSVGYAHQKFVNDQPVILSNTSSVGFPGKVGDPIIMKGKNQGNVPDWNGYVAAQYVIPLGSSSLKLRADASYRGKLFADLANLTVIKSSWTVNGRITFEEKAWEMSLFGRNLFNNQRSTGSGLAGGTAACGFVETNTAVYGTNQQCLYASPARPREIGLEASYRF